MLDVIAFVLEDHSVKGVHVIGRDVGVGREAGVFQMGKQMSTPDDTQVYYRVAAVPGHELVQHPQGDIGVVVSYQVDRIGSAPELGQHFVEGLYQLRVQVGNLKTVFIAQIGGDDSPTAAEGHDRHPVALGQWHRRKGCREIQQVHGLIGQDHPGLPTGGVKHTGIRGQSTGMAGRGPFTGLGSPPSQDDHRLSAADLAA